MKQSNDAGLGAGQRRAGRVKSEAAEQTASADRERATSTGPGSLADVAPAAEAVVEELVAPTQNDPLAEAAHLARGGYFQEAAEAYRSYLTRHPEDAAARRGLAAVLEQRGDFVGALGELGRAIDSQPDDVSLLCARASVQMALQRYDQAEADLRRATKLDADSPDVLYNFGMLFCKRARWREAIEPLQRAVELDPSSSQGHYYLGEAYNQTDQLKLALASYEEAVKLQPTSYRALKGVGIVLDKLGRPAEATAAYQRARHAQRR
jgi:tetratricopeptide (TPR) repeat protein